MQNRDKYQKHTNKMFCKLLPTRTKYKSSDDFYTHSLT